MAWHKAGGHCHGNCCNPKALKGNFLQLLCDVSVLVFPQDVLICGYNCLRPRVQSVMSACLSRAVYSSEESAKAKTQKELIKTLKELKLHLPSEKRNKRSTSSTLNTLKYALHCVKQVKGEGVLQCS